MQDSVAFELSSELYQRILAAEAMSQLRKPMIGIGISFIGIGAFCFYDYYKHGSTELFELWAPVVLLLGLGLGVALRGMPVYLARHPLNRKDFQLTTVSITPDFLVVQLADRTRGEIPFSHIVKVRSTRSYTLFWTNIYSSVLVPAEAFANVEEYHTFVARVVQNTDVVCSA